MFRNLQREQKIGLLFLIPYSAIILFLTVLVLVVRDAVAPATILALLTWIPFAGFIVVIGAYYLGRETFADLGPVLFVTVTLIGFIVNSMFLYACVYHSTMLIKKLWNRRNQVEKLS